MSDTPETDLEAMDGKYRYCGSTITLQSWDYEKDTDGEVVPVDFARRLERERDALREENRKLRELCIGLRNALHNHADYRIQHNGGHTIERILIEKTDEILKP